MDVTQKPRILFVEDEPIIQRAYRRIMGREAEVLIAETCDQALALAKQHKGDLRAIVFDYSLAAEKTTAIIPIIRESYGPDFPLLGCTAEEEGQTHQLALGCSEVFGKPELAPLFARLRELIAAKP